jgi:methyl-accepting chemotaxis protein
MKTTRRTGGIQFLMAGSIALTVSVVLGLLGGADYFRTKSAMLAQLRAELSAISERLATNIAGPLWDMNMNAAGSVLGSEMSNPNVFASMVVHEGKIVAGVGRDEAWQVIPRTALIEAGEYESATIPIVFERNNKKNGLGSLEVYMSKRFLNEALRDTLLGILIRVIVVDCILVLGLFFLIRVFMMRPLGILQTFATEVQGGNLNAKLGHGRFIFELSDLKQAVQSMVHNLKAKITEVEQKQAEALLLAEQAGESAKVAEEARKAAEQARHEGQMHAVTVLETIVQCIDASMHAMAALVEQVAAGADRQAQRLTETAAAMDEMNATVLEVAKNASHTSEQAALTRTEAQRGTEIVAQALASVMGMSVLARELSENMTNLDRQAEGIGTILNVITDIADQTNLLALNAAIEAARAGDAGRGFAVVADEVRKLAEKTMAATQQVDQSIRGIQVGAKTSSAATHKAVGSVGAAKELSEESGRALDKIRELVDRTSALITSIATAAEEQSATSDQIARSTNEINHISELTTQQMGQASKTIEVLGRQVEELKSLINTLRA